MRLMPPLEIRGRRIESSFFGGVTGAEEEEVLAAKESTDDQGWLLSFSHAMPPMNNRVAKASHQVPALEEALAGGV